MPSKKKAAERRIFLLDTNVLMHDPTCIFRFEEHDIFIPMIVLEELDGHKKGMTEVARNGRQASRTLDALAAAGMNRASIGVQDFDPVVQEAVNRIQSVEETLAVIEACREAGLPSPLVEMPTDLTGQGRAVVATSRRNGFWFGRPRNRTHSEGLANLVAALGRDPALDVQIVPVSIFVGRAPDRESGWFRVLFAENWVIVGGFRRLLAVLLNGRNTIVRFSAPSCSPARSMRRLRRWSRSRGRSAARRCRCARCWPKGRRRKRRYARSRACCARTSGASVPR